MPFAGTATMMGGMIMIRNRFMVRYGSACAPCAWELRPAADSGDLSGHCRGWTGAWHGSGFFVRRIRREARLCRDR